MVRVVTMGGYGSGLYLTRNPMVTGMPVNEYDILHNDRNYAITFPTEKEASSLARWWMRTQEGWHAYTQVHMGTEVRLNG